MNPNYQSENPLKTFLQTLLVLGLVFLFTLLMNGCASKPLEKTHTIERVVTYKADSLKVTVVNQAVLGSLFIYKTRRNQYANYSTISSQRSHGTS